MTAKESATCTSPHTPSYVEFIDVPEECTKVLMLQNLVRGVTEVDISSLIQNHTQCYSKSLKVYLQIFSGLGFVEFEDERDCYRAFTRLNEAPIVIDGKAVKAVLSRRKYVTTVSEQLSDSRVILITVSNLVQRVSVKQLYTVFSRVGKVDKIFIFSESSACVRGFIEFAEADSVRDAILNFNNSNLLSGANTMQLEPSKLDSLFIRLNHRNAWDYTVDPNGYQDEEEENRLNEQRNVIRVISAAQNGLTSSSELQTVMNPQVKRLLGHPVVADAALQGYNRVIVVYYVPTRYNVPDKLFNLFSTCGQIERIKVMRDREAIALIQFTDNLYAALSLLYYQGVKLQKDAVRGLKIDFSRNSEILTTRTVDSFDLTRVYHSRDQRFPKREDRYLRQACAPTSSLYITPLDTLLGTNILLEKIRKQIEPLKLDPIETVVVGTPQDRGAMILVMEDGFKATELLIMLHSVILDDHIDLGPLRVSFSRRVPSTEAPKAPRKKPKGAGHLKPCTKGPMKPI